MHHASDPAALLVPTRRAAQRNVGRLLLVAILAGLLGALPARAAGPATLVLDINQTGGPFPNNSSSPHGLAAIGSTLYFSADDGTRGSELWKSDGTANGTKLVKNINNSSGASSSPGELTNLNGTLYFSADDGDNGRELWRSDGSGSGTVVQDINIGPGASSPADLTASNDTLYFSADDGASGRELWRTDVVSGAVMVKDIFGAPGAASNPTGLTDVNGTLFFTANDGVHGIELWKSDGTITATQQVKDINLGLVGPPGSNSSNPAHLTNVNGTLYFSADDGLNGVELWKSDGTMTNTLLIEDINSAFAGAASNPANLTNVNGTLFFTANDGVHGIELWRSDGTITGTLMLRDIHLGAGDSSPASLTNVNGTLFFTANDGVHGIELWRSDGTPAGTALVKDINAGVPDSSPSDLANVDSTLLFAANDGVAGRELWKSRGTAATTVVVQNIASGAGDSNPAGFTVRGTDVFFSASDDTAGNELWSIPTDALNFAPSASNRTFATPLNTPVSGTLIASDPEGSPLTFSIVNNGGKGVALITNPASGAFTYTPMPAASGNDTFTFRASDGLTNSNVATVTVTIGNHVPVANNSALQTAQNTPASGTLSASDADGNPLTFSIVMSGGKGVATITNATTGAFTYTPNAGASGGDSFTFKVNDGLVDSNIATVTVTIGPPNHPPVANGAFFHVAMNHLYSGTLSASDSDGDSLTFSIVANGSKGVVAITNAASGAFTYTPSAGVTGGDSFTFKVDDGKVDSNVAIVNITIDKAHIYLPLVRR